MTLKSGLFDSGRIPVKPLKLINLLIKETVTIMPRAWRFSAEAARLAR
jgi:hypothetical protein